MPQRKLPISPHGMGNVIKPGTSVQDWEWVLAGPEQDVGGLGHRSNFGPNWTPHIYTGILSHFASGTVRDAISENNGKVSSYTNYSFQISLDYSF